MTLKQEVQRWVRAEEMVREARSVVFAQLRDYKGKVKVRELARRVKVSPAAISSFLGGDTTIASATAARIVDALPECLDG